MSLGETELIRTYFNPLCAFRDDVVLGIGDDGAVLALPPHSELVVSTDSLAEGVHFFSDAAPADVGYKSLSVNLSDMAAMGAEPRWATLALSMPGVDDKWLRGFAKGFAAAAASCDGVALVGGDLSRGPLVITVQIMGTVPRGAALRRIGARPGDIIFVTGALGAAGAALAVLKGELDKPAAGFEEAMVRLLRPKARVQTGLLLRGLANAAIDISDGLYTDLAHIAEESGVGARVELQRLPIHTTLESIPDPYQRWDRALGSGDDYELCFTIPAAREQALWTCFEIAGMPRITRIGEITGGAGIQWLAPDGTSYRPERAGYRHF